MLFNSFVFLLGFLPAALALHAMADRYAPQWRLHVLLLLSFAFYAYWDWRFAPLLAASILLNWAIAGAFIATRQNAMIVAAIAANLLLLAFFKYFNFFGGLAQVLALPAIPRLEWVLPLGISFFTFHHVMYLSDLKAGRAPRYDLVRYGLYISFFPQVLAGPLVRWSELMHQFETRAYGSPESAERFARGIMLLTLGLSKKVFLGDPLAEYANPVFQAALEGRAVAFAEAWQGVLAFTFQIYFDFSGYTDMALGLALMFGIVLPQNFDAPYRAVSLPDFWRRWHMTLSRFLRDYLYIPLGGNRHGAAIQIGALFATMALGGLWHGAGLTFVAWGIVHGIGLGIATVWRLFNLPIPRILGWALTFLGVTLAWVLFRAQSFDAALHLYQSLFGFGPSGGTVKWRSLVIAAAIATIGPTAWTMVHRLPPRRWIAVLFAALFVAVLLKIGDDANYEFIYFQF